jgi:hypothetical protein
VRLLLDAGAIKDDHTLAYTWISADEVRWSLVKSQMLRTLDGSYALAARDGGRRTEVTYQLTVDVKIPMLGMIKRKAEKVIIDRALAGLKKRVESGVPAVTGAAGPGAAADGPLVKGAAGGSPLVKGAAKGAKGSVDDAETSG